MGSLKAGSWELDIRTAEHNHEASSTIAAHLSLRRLTEEQKANVASLTRAGAAPRTITNAILQNLPATASVTVKDIYNARQKIRTETLAGRTPISALAEQLDANEFSWQVKTDNQGHITHLYFAERNNLALYKRYPEVLLLDCIYKTNRFKMPLLNMVEMTGLNTTFYVAFAFVRTEQEEDFTWALQQFIRSTTTTPGIAVTDRDLGLMNSLESQLPRTTHLLCQWHIAKNILGKCKVYFPIASSTTNSETPFDQNDWTIFSKRWNQLVRSSTAESFNEG